jgi:hypothetical protein
MPKISDQKLSRICLRIWTEDYQKARHVSDQKNKRNKIIRAVVHNFFARFETEVRNDLNRILETSK